MPTANQIANYLKQANGRIKKYEAALKKERAKAKKLKVDLKRAKNAGAKKPVKKE